MRGPVEIVEEYIAASQRARTTGAPEDFAILRRLLADDASVRLAAPWSDEPWRLAYSSADAIVTRLRAPVNRHSSLATENVNVVSAGDDVLVEQLSTITMDSGRHISMVCHIFSVADGLITGIRTYRNDNGLPAG